MDPESTHVSGRRLVAHFLDGIVFAFIFAVAIIPFAAFSETAIIIYLVAMATLGHIAYFVIAQRKTGQSPGKRVAGIRVVDEDGEVPDTGSLVRRSIPLLFEYFYVIAFISMQSSRYRQRLGDRWGDTYVVRAENSGVFRSIEERAGLPGSCPSCGQVVKPGTDVCPSCGRLAPLGR